MSDQLLKTDVGALLHILIHQLDQRVQLLHALVLVDWVGHECFSAVLRRSMVQKLQIIKHFLDVFSVVRLNAVERFPLA